MNKRQKLVQAQFLNNEEAVIRRLKSIYCASLKDIEKKAQALQDDINRLDAMARLAVSDEEKAQLLSMQQSKIYQKQYQDAMKKQIGSILDNMQVEGFKTVSEYLQKCYEDGFVGTMFDLQGQGIPLCFPMDQEAMVMAVQLDSKISQGLYSRLGEDVSMLKRTISAEVSRGISTGTPFAQVAQQIKARMIGNYDDRPGGALYRAMTIARTEGHRIQVQSGMDACYKARDKGADVVKQWDATLDSSTRESHVAVDGEVRELDEPFSNGLMFPGDPSGKAEEVILCRCALLQRARWALDDSFTKMDNESGEIVDFSGIDDYNEFKKQYLKAASQQVSQQASAQTPAKTAVIAKIADAVDFSALDKYLQSQYNISVDDSVKSLDFDTVKSSLVGVENVIKEYPGLADSITKVTTSKGGVMSCSGEKITFNPHYYSNNTKLVEDCKKQSASRFWIPNASPESIGAHESAHAIEWMMLQKNSGAYQYDWQRIDAWNKCTEAKKLVSQACKNIKKTPYGKGKKNVELIGGISRYGQETASETMAEAFADVYANGEKANPLSIEIKRLTAETVKNYEGGIFP